MAIYELPVSSVPNQYFTTSLNGDTWGVTIETRLDKLYLSLTKNNIPVVYNRVGLDKTSIDDAFMFYDTAGGLDPTYDGLGVRFLLLWWDGVA